MELKKESVCFYVIVVDTKGGSQFTPAFIKDDYEGWEKDWHDATEYYRKRYENDGYVSTRTGSNLYDAGVTDLNGIENWKDLK